MKTIRVFLVVLAMCGLPFLMGLAAEKTSPVGFFYFDGYREVGSESFRSGYVRMAIEWRQFEPRKGVWNERNEQAQKIDALLSQGMNVVPAIRSKSNWAVEDPHGSKCASAPLDIDVKSPLKEGVVYSESYYRFVQKIAERYKGKFEIVVIENEMNDPDDFWCSSVDKYLRVFLTAKRAFKDADPQVKVADGGIQGYILNSMLIKDYLDKGNPSAAIAFYKKFSGQTIGQKELMNDSAKQSSKDIFKRAVQLYDSDLYSWADAVNFHYYQKSEALPEVVAYLRKRLPRDKPLMTNEIGIKDKYSGGADEASKEMIKKFTRLLALGVRPVIWFSPSGRKEHNAGALVNSKGELIQQTRNSFEAVSRFLGRRHSFCEHTSDDEWEKFLFRFPDETVEILWPKDEKRSATIEIERGCRAFNYQNEALNEGKVSAQSAPLFVVCD